MDENRLTPNEVEKLEEVQVLIEKRQPGDLKRAIRLIHEVLYSAAPVQLNGLGQTMTRTPPNFVDNDEGWG